MKHLKSFMNMNVSGLEHITATYDEISEEGTPISRNNKLSFYAVEPDLIQHIEGIREILAKKLNEE